MVFNGIYVVFIQYASVKRNDIMSEKSYQKMSLCYHITVEPRYLKHNPPWKIFPFSKLPASAQELYTREGIDNWMKKNVKDALWNADVKIRDISADHKLTMEVSLSPKVVHDYLMTFSSQRRGAKKAAESTNTLVIRGLYHYLEQTRDTGRDGDQWAYGVSLKAETCDKQTNDKYTMVFKIIKLTKITSS